MNSKTGYRVTFGTFSITDNGKKYLDEAVKSMWVTQGKYVEALEHRFAQQFGTRYAVAASTGTDALAVACSCLYERNAKRGDEIIVPALTFVASANAIYQAGFKPVFVDVTTETLNIDIRKIEAAITPRTRAIMPVHLMGKPADMNAILFIARKHNLHIIEDGCEAHGATYYGKKVGTFGDMGCFSLYASHIVTSVEGGMMVTDSTDLNIFARSLRNHGMVGKFVFDGIGYSSKMHELEAAVGLGNMEIFDDTVYKRKQNLHYLIDKFKEKFSQYFWHLTEHPHEVLGPHAFSMVIKPSAGFGKVELVQYLDSHSIDTRNLFQSIPTQTRGYEFMGHKLGEFPEAEYCGYNGLHIGCHQHLNLGDMEYVVTTISNFLMERGE
jgi:dTDP-4-amino-4,6-dideoxygalactose transaminase